MDPGRAAMIAGRRPPDRRDITSPRRDTNHRISKPPFGSSSAPRRDEQRRPPPQKERQQLPPSYLTEEQLSEKFVAEEDRFVLRQSKKKADIRVRERRAKPIDFLVFNLRFADADRDTVEDDAEADVRIAVPAPDAVLASIAKSETQLKELEADIKSFRTLETDSQNRAYWQALLVLCRDALQQLGGASRAEDRRIIGQVGADIDAILAPKSLAQLEALEKQIDAKLRRARNEDSTEVIDTDYWEQLRKQLQVWKAKAMLKKINEAARETRLRLLRELAPGNEGEADKAGANDTDGDQEEAMDNGTLEKAVVKGKTVGFSDDSASSAPPPGTARFATAASSNNDEDFSQATRALYEREVARGVSENEEIFAAEEVVPGQAGAKPKWADKYRPRKPRYFNRVQMGYEWNKYNQTHYDHDNPPPKVVQGYKFNIFYPELIDKTKAPTYHITREGGRRKGESFAPAGEEDTCLIRFTAGPPYEDIAFRIVDREWDYSAKRERGFKSVFEKGILQLHFQFKKIYYRK